MRLHLLTRVVVVVVMLSFYVSSRAQRIQDLSTDQRVLNGTEWTLVSFGPAGGENDLIAGTEVTLKFQDDTRVGGSTGCNSYGGSYQVRGNSISFGRLISTRRACVVQRANEQEQRFILALEAASRFRVSTDRLTILSDRGRTVLNFVNSEAGEADSETRDDPVATLASFYEAINARDFRRAYRYWENPPSSFQQFAGGFVDTDRVQLLVDPSPRVDGAAGSAYAEISTIIVAKTRAGSERIFAGCYVMRRSNVQDRGWRIYRADVSAVTSTTRLARILSQGCHN